MPTYDDSDDSDIERAKVLIDGQAVTPSEMDWQPSIGKAPSSRPNVSTYDSARGGGVMKPVRKEAAQPLTPSYNDNDSCSSSRSSSSSRSDGIHANATRGQPAAQPRAVPSGKSSGVVNRLTRSTATTKGGPNYGKVLSFAEEEEREQRRRERALREPRRLPDDKPKFTQPVERERLRKLAAPRTVEMPEAAVSPTENHQRTRHIDPALYERLGKRAGEEDVSTGSGEALAPRRVANAEATNRLAAPRPAPIATTATHGDRSSSAPTARRGTPGAAYTRPVGSPGPRATGNAAVRRSRAALSNTEAFIKEFRDRKVSHYGGTTMLPEGPHFHHRAHHGQPSEEGHRRRNNDPTWSSMAAAASVLTGTAAGNGNRQGTVSPTTPQSSSSASYGRNHNVSIPHATRQALRQQQERERQAEANECKQVDSVFAPKDLTRAPRRIRAKRYVAPEDGESAWSPVGMGDDDFLDESEDRPPFAANRAAIPPVVMAGPKRSMSEPPLIIHAKRRKAAPPPEEEVEQPKRQAKKKK